MLRNVNNNFKNVIKPCPHSIVFYYYYYSEETIQI